MIDKNVDKSKSNPEPTTCFQMVENIELLMKAICRARDVLKISSAIMEFSVSNIHDSFVILEEFVLNTNGTFEDASSALLATLKNFSSFITKSKGSVSDSFGKYTKLSCILHFHPFSCRQYALIQYGKVWKSKLWKSSFM